MQGNYMEFERDFFYDEVQEGFYVPGIMKRAWASKVELLSDVDYICKKWGISYYIGYGTLLGAVRHKGFIPWDDDIDIVMLRTDYEKFRQVVDKELAEGMSFVCIEADRNRCDYAAAVCVLPNLFFPRNLRKYHEFPYDSAVDIFVMDELSISPEDESIRQNILARFMHLIYFIDQKREKSETFLSKLEEIEELLQIKFDREAPLKGQIYEFMNKLFQEHNGEGGEKLVNFPDYLIGGSVPVPKSAFMEGEALAFCNTKFPAPKDYDTVLRSSYGDYSRKEKKGGAHDYPSFKKKDKEMKDLLGEKWNFNYSFSEDAFHKSEVQNLRSTALEMLESLSTLEKNIFQSFMVGDFYTCLNLIANCQESAITLGNVIEQKKGEGTEAVSLLEEYCEALYHAYQMLESFNTISGQASGEIRDDIELQLRALGTHLEKIHTALKRELKKQIVFLPHRLKHFESLRPFISALGESGNFDCKIIPIPYYDRLGDGSLSEMHYEGEDFSKEYDIIDYRSFNFAEELPDAIVINSPYDEFNQVFTVDPFFYSKEMRKYTNKLIYIPYFVTDEINPADENDGKAFYNMNYYVTVPGVFYADLTIVQSEQMKKAYLEKISEFTNKEISKKMEKKISGAGSCLFGDKEGQGVKEVAEELLRFINKS